MLDHQKIVLQGVADNLELFRKELMKSIAWLNDEERTELLSWLKEEFGQTHKQIINEVLFTIAA